MNKLHTFLLGRLLITLTIVCVVNASSLGGVMNVGASAISQMSQTNIDDQVVTSAKGKIYNDTDTAWTYTGQWSKNKIRRALGGQIHVSNVVEDHATISITGSSFTLIYSTSRDYGELDVFIDDLKIHTINQNKSRASHQKEWDSPELASGTHVLKFVNASGKAVNIDAIKVRGPKLKLEPTPTSVPTGTAAPTLTPSEGSNPTESPISPEIPILTVSPSPTNSIPVESPTSTALPEATPSPTPFEVIPPSSTPTASLIPPSTASPTPSQLPSPTASITSTPSSTPFLPASPVPSFTATITPTIISTATSAASPTPTSTSVPVTGTQVFYVSTAGSDANPGSLVQPLRTIQKAVSLASAGTIIRVLAGNYPESISLGKSYISLTAEPNVFMKGFFITGHNNLVRGFIISNPSSDFGIRVTGNNNVIEKNDISNTGQDGIWFFGSGNRFIGNYVHDIVDRSKITYDPHVDCFQTWGPAENIVFEKNICNHTSTSGSNQIIMLENLTPPVRNITFKNNIFIMRDPGYSPINFDRKAGQDVISDMYVINNTIVHENGIGQYGVRLINITNAQVINNIFINYGDQYNSYVLVNGGSGIKINNNAIYKSDNVAPKGGPYPGDIWLQNLGLANLIGHDFHLTAASPLIDTGTALGSVSDDFEGNLRPIGNNHDIGAFEYTAITYKLQLETIQAESGTISPPTAIATIQVP